MSSPVPDSVPPGAPVVPQGPVPAVGIPNSQDYPRLVYTAPRFEVVAIADIIAPSVLEACEALLPSLVPPYVDAAADAAVASLAVVLTGSTMTGPLNLSPTMPTAPTMAATRAYVDSMISTVIPEVPPVPIGQAWARETGQWIPLAGGGSVTNIATGAGLTGGPITATGTIAMANMAANSLKGNNTATVTAPTDLNVGQVMTMLGAAPLNSPIFTGAPTLPSGTQAVTQPGGTNNTTVATTAFVAASSALALPLTGGTMTGAIVLAGNAAANLNPVPLQQLTTSLGSYLPLTGGILAGTGNLTIRGGVLVGAAGAVPAAGGLILNGNAGSVLAAGGQLQLNGADAAPAYAIFQAYGGPAQLYLGRSDGTFAAQTPVQAGDQLGAVIAQGHGATSAGNGAFLSFEATENWTDTAHGSDITFNACGLGSTTPVTSAKLTNNTATFTGTVTATGALTVAATAGVATSYLNGSHQYYTQADASNNWQLIDATVPAQRIIVDGTGNCRNTTGTWSTISDPRTKTDMAPWNEGLQAVLALNPITFAYNGLGGTTDDGREHLGLDASEVQAVLPDLVLTSEQPLEAGGEPTAVLSVDLGKLVFPLINAVKELAARLETLEVK
jgi:hypothetical protein